MKTRVATDMFRAIRRSFTEGVHGMVKNGLMTVTSLFVVTACIFVFGVFLMCIFNINAMTDKMADDYQVDVYIERTSQIKDDTISVFVQRPEGIDDVTHQANLDTLKTQIMGVANVDLSSITFYDGKSRLTNFKAGLSEKELEGFASIYEGALSDSYDLKLENYDLKVETLRKLSELGNVEKVMDATEVYSMIATIGSMAVNVSDEKYEEIKAQILDEIKKIGNIDHESVKFVKGEDKFASFREGLTPEELQGYEGLPDDFMPDAYTVRLKDLSVAEDTIAELKQISHVESVENNRELVSIIDSLKSSVQTVSIWIIVAFAIVSLFIISNTIKLTVHNRRKEINIMKYVGATDSYISGPFIMEGILLGLVSAGIAFFVSSWTYEGLVTAISSEMTSLPFAGNLVDFGVIWSQLLVAYLVLGGFIGAFGSSISVRRYLNV